MYKKFFAAFNRSVQQGNPLTRQELISGFTNGRTNSLKELTPFELNELIIQLNRNSDFKANPQQTDQKADKMRKALIAIFHDMNRPPAAAAAWAQKQGVKGIKKQLNDYNNQELFALIRVAKKVREDYYAALRKGLSSNFS